jgi:hypothetical protein
MLIVLFTYRVDGSIKEKYLAPTTFFLEAAIAFSAHLQDDSESNEKSEKAKQICLKILLEPTTARLYEAQYCDTVASV